MRILILGAVAAFVIVLGAAVAIGLATWLS